MPYNFDFPRALPATDLHADIRTAPEDFVVNEQLAFPLSGEGEHLYLQIKKRNTNTHWLAKKLSEFSGVPLRDIGYAGLKDRYAVTTQWFSLRMVKRKNDDWQAFDCDEYQIVNNRYHQGKLRKGAIKQNDFVITLRNIEGDAAQLQQRFAELIQHGVPNYFAEQRFGHAGGNIDAALALFSGKRSRNKNTRGMYISAARSWIFNQVLAQRIRADSWQQALAGEALMLEGSDKCFLAEQIDSALIERVVSMDVHPSGPLWGVGEPLCAAQVRALESDVAQQWSALSQGLESVGMKQARRALRIRLREPQLAMSTMDKSVTLSFSLPAGSYATAVLGELLDYRNLSGNAELADE